MEQHLKVLFVDVSNGFYKIKKYKLGEFFGPVDLGLHLSGKYNTLNIGTGLLAGSIFPGSNRVSSYPGFTLTKLNTSIILSCYCLNCRTCLISKIYTQV